MVVDTIYRDENLSEPVPIVAVFLFISRLLFPKRWYILACSGWQQTKPTDRAITPERLLTGARKPFYHDKNYLGRSPSCLTIDTIHNRHLSFYLIC